jgi:rhomboid-like protein
VGFFFIPVPGGSWTLFLGTTIWNVVGTVLRWGTFDYAAHLGGSICGLAYGYWYNRKRKEQIRKRRVVIDF